MHTDEYEISLSREIEVCRNKVIALQKRICLLEKKFNISTENFMKEFGKAGTDNPNDDFIAWFNDCSALEKWRETLREYQKLFLCMKK